jgi:hypothetical protein
MKIIYPKRDELSGVCKDWTWRRVAVQSTREALEFVIYLTAFLVALIYFSPVFIRELLKRK